MAYITRQEQTNGQWWTWINTTGLDCEVLITPGRMSEAEASAWRTSYLAAHEYDDVPQAVVNVYERHEIIKAAVLWIRANNPNMTQWNNYLASLAWDDAYAVRWFLARLAVEIAARKEIVLSSHTEVQVLAALKAWIIAAPLKRLAKVLLGESGPAASLEARAVSIVDETGQEYVKE